MSVTRVDYSEFLLKIGDNGSPESFAQDCLINGDKALEIVGTYTEDLIPDCDSPEAPAEVLIFPEAVRMTASGTGKMNKGDAKAYADWASSMISKNCQIEVGSVGESGAFKINTPLKLVNFSIRASRPTTVEVDVSFQAVGFKPSDITAL